MRLLLLLDTLHRFPYEMKSLGAIFRLIFSLYSLFATLTNYISIFRSDYFYLSKFLINFVAA